ncbi:adhesive plaque matrix protein 2-like isoform X2 [Mytilus edulis]|uniref:adhesive plaque matrix protein 2-like isoform X2 n=1 Tax=Mytilus edulis TaxID=6550 RepID=UPI0039EDF6A0
MEMQLVLIVSLVSCYCTKYVIGVTTQSSENDVVKVKNLIAEVTVMKNNYQELLKRVRNIEIEIVDLTNQEKYWKNELENIKRYMACQIEELNDIYTENNDKLNETKAALMKTMISFSQSLTLMNQTIQELSHSRPETLRCEGNLTECSFTSVTPCNSSPCVNSGSCLTVNGSNLCFCPKGYSGKLCEVDPCDSLPCGNGGTQTLLGTTCQCSCRSGFSGLLCEVTPCTSQPCLYGGSCVISGDSYSCNCSKGFSGNSCEETPCSSSPCVNSGSCLNVNGSFVCVCSLGYFGKLCEVDPCDGFRCGNGGTKTLSGTVCQCTCRGGFSGSSCEVTPCISSPCLNSGTCFNVDGTYTCACQNGYSGTRCEVTPCSRTICLNQGTCSIVNSNLRCTCKSGFSGRFCEVTPCTSNPCRCGTCSVSGSSYACSCPSGLQGSQCEMLFTETITSPDFPSTYTDNLNLAWTIDAGSRNRVEIRFTSFDLETCCDYVKVYNGASSSNLLGSYNGKNIPSNHITTGRYMYITFTTDSSVERKGFSANIYKILT